MLVLGCGNVLFGDDGFGPAVAKRLAGSPELPADVCVVDAGIGSRGILFTIALSNSRPERIVVVDAVDAGRTPGEVFEIGVADIPERKIDDFSMHQLPTSNLLRELDELCGVVVTIVAVQVRDIPESVRPGLSDVVRDAVPVACRKVLERCAEGRPSA